MFFRFNFDWIHPTEYSILYPEIFTLKEVKPGSTLRGQVGNVLPVPWSGTHLTDYGLPALILAKLTGLAEGGKRHELTPYLKNPGKVMERIAEGVRPCCPKSRPCTRYEDLSLPPKIIPWVALANKEHFPEMFPQEFPNFLDMRRPRLRLQPLQAEEEEETYDDVQK
jgi:hypothetical protein